MISNVSQKTENSTIQSPLRYPGSKRGLVDYIKQTLALNNLSPSLYIEPFVGGGSVAINLLKANLVQRVILVDIDPWITSFWKTVFFDTAWLVDQIRVLEVSTNRWKLYKESQPRTVRDQALTCLFLNRTSFSGILEARAGPIGGKQQNSDYKIDCRFTQTTRKTIIKRIEQISKYKDRIHGIWNCSWREALQRIRVEQNQNKLPQSNLFFYLDPPFFEKAEALYRFYFLDDDHKALRDELMNLKDKWLLSYDSADEVQNLYGEAIKMGINGTRQHNIELTYSIAKISQRKKGKEVIISNLERLPEPTLVFSNKPD